MSFLRSFFRKRRATEQKVDVSQRFDLVSRLGTGSMSKVWRAVDKKLGHVVALKVLDVEKTLRYESRFTDRVKPTEGAVASQLMHKNIVRTLDHGITTRNEQFLVMELVEGIGLAYLVDMNDPGIDVVGPLPREVSPPTGFVGFVSAHAKDPAAAKALLNYLSSSDAEAVYKADGMQPHQ